MAVTLLLDTLGSDDASGLSQVDACAVYTLACLGVTYGMQDRRYCFFQPVCFVVLHACHQAVYHACMCVLAATFLNSSTALHIHHQALYQNICVYRR